MSEHIYFANGPKCGESMHAPSASRPIVFDCVEHDEFASYATCGGNAGNVLVRRGTVTYFVDRYCEYIGPYIRRMLFVASSGGPVDTVQMLDDRRFMDYRECQPWEVYPAKGSQDFDGWWALKMMEIGRERTDPLAYQWAREMRCQSNRRRPERGR